MTEQTQLTLIYHTGCRLAEKLRGNLEQALDHLIGWDYTAVNADELEPGDAKKIPYQCPSILFLDKDLFGQPPSASADPFT